MMGSRLNLLLFVLCIFANGYENPHEDATIVYHGQDPVAAQKALNDHQDRELLEHRRAVDRYLEENGHGIEGRDVNLPPHLAKRVTGKIGALQIPDFDLECRSRDDENKTYFKHDPAYMKVCLDSRQYEMNCLYTSEANHTLTKRLQSFMCPELTTCIKVYPDLDFTAVNSRRPEPYRQEVGCVNYKRTWILVLEKHVNKYVANPIRALLGARRFYGRFMVAGELPRLDWFYEWRWSPMIRGGECRYLGDHLAEEAGVERFLHNSSTNTKEIQVYEISYNMDETPDFCFQAEFATFTNHTHKLVLSGQEGFTNGKVERVTSW